MRHWHYIPPTELYTYFKDCAKRSTTSGKKPQKFMFWFCLQIRIVSHSIVHRAHVKWQNFQKYTHCESSVRFHSNSNRWTIFHLHFLEEFIFHSANNSSMNGEEMGTTCQMKHANASNSPVFFFILKFISLVKQLQKQNKTNRTRKTMTKMKKEKKWMKTCFTILCALYICE